MMPMIEQQEEDVAKSGGCCRSLPIKMIVDADKERYGNC